MLRKRVAESGPRVLDDGRESEFERFEGVVIRDFGGDERSEGADVGVVGVGSDVDAERFEAGRKFVLDL